MTKAFWIQTFLLLHVLGAIAALGPTLTYGLWRWRAEAGGREHLLFTLQTVGWIDSRLATPGYVAQAVTGITLILLEGRSLLHTAWLLVGVAIYVVIVVVAGAAYAPMVGRQKKIAARLNAAPQDASIRAEYDDVSSRSRTMGLAIVGLTVLIVYLMVVKPPLWSAA